MRIEDRGRNWIPSVIVLSLGWLLIYAARTALSSALKDIGDYWGLSESFLGFLTSSFFIAYTALQVPSGLVADKMGSKKVLLAGFAIQALGLVFGALSKSPIQFLLARVLTGAGQASYFACQQAITSFAVPKDRRSLGVAITTGGAGVGSAAGFLLGKFLSSGGYGWKMPFVLLGAVSAAFMLAVLTFVPEPGKPGKARGAGACGTFSNEDAPARRSLKEGAAGLALLAASHFLSMYGFYVMLTWMPYYLERVRGIQGRLSAVIPIVMPLIMAPATVAGGMIADKKRSKTLVVVWAMPIAAAATFLIPAMKSPVSLTLALALYGATGKLVIDPGLVAAVTENSPPDMRNTALAIFNSWGACAMAVAPAVTGFIAQVTDSFDVSFHAAGFLNLLGLCCFLAGAGKMRTTSRSSRPLSHS